jgi:hypothetical protein
VKKFAKMLWIEAVRVVTIVGVLAGVWMAYDMRQQTRLQREAREHTEFDFADQEVIVTQRQGTTTQRIRIPAAMWEKMNPEGNRMRFTIPGESK